jgi:ribosomal-protein-alanine N-acetyltransferase
MNEIRPITEKDLAEIAKTEQLLFSDPWSEEAIRSFLALSHAQGYVCLRDSHVYGYLLGSLLAEEAELLRIGVKKESQRMGLGEALLAHAIALWKEKGAGSVFLEVRASNEAAQHLYEKKGFVPVGKRPRFYRHPTEDALLYCLHIRNED